ncbi:MAG TPA: single-stranded-DNA-specific exonuclease RecJ [Candidatus Megaira endosymbiont of Nemacystus decipiens]|nr:single-stranded-DNA-specific exonuclease RecJ [Candidatus Megaera endosymbiont of Nemacystus decipiens]
MKYSVSGKMWLERLINEDIVSDIKKNLGTSDFVSRLISRNIKNIEQAEKFLYPKIKTLLPDPFHLKDMEKGVKRCMQAILSGETICIFGDYDVDGATSSALLKNFFDSINVKSFIYIPDRIEEGYGPNISAMDKIKNKNASLVITVDCGSVSFDAIKHAVDIKLDVIVIDHHISMEILPKAVAVINPNRLDETSDYTYLAAVGVTFLFLVGLSRRLKEDKFFEKNKLQLPDLIKQLDLVALGTVCDVMPLIGLNRAFVAQGLKVAKRRFNLGYKTLCDIAGIDSELSAYHLGFIIGPRINAGGRVGRSDLGANLLSSKKKDYVNRVAIELDNYNQERRAIEHMLLEDAKLQAESQLNKPMIFIIGNDWHQGVIGIIAGRIKDKYNKPAFVLSLKNGVGKASCRSVKGIDIGCKIIEAKQQNLLLAGGGHAMAAGFSVSEDKIDELKKFLEFECQKHIQNSQKHLEFYYDLEISTKGATHDLVNELALLEPYGVGNSTPIFKFSNLYVLKADMIALKHAKVIFAPSKAATGSSPIYAIAFNINDTPIQKVVFNKLSKQLDVFGKLQINKWQNVNNIQLVIEDIVEK